MKQQSPNAVIGCWECDKPVEARDATPRQIATQYGDGSFAGDHIAYFCSSTCADKAFHEAMEALREP